MHTVEMVSIVTNMKRSGESINELIDRISSSDRLLDKIVSVCSTCSYNRSMIKKIINSEKFKNKLK